MLQIVSEKNGLGFRGYKSAADRERAIKALRKAGCDYFTKYKDTQAEFALVYGRKNRKPWR